MPGTGPRASVVPTTGEAYGLYSPRGPVGSVYNFLLCHIIGLFIIIRYNLGELG